MSPSEIERAIERSEGHLDVLENALREHWGVYREQKEVFDYWRKEDPDDYDEGEIEEAVKAVEAQYADLQAMHRGVLREWGNATAHARRLAALAEQCGIDAPHDRAAARGKGGQFKKARVDRGLPMFLDD